MPSLKIVKGPGEGARLTLTERATLGRSSECDLHIRDVESSRVHAQISLQEGRYHIKDLDSSNGTLVNGSPVGEHVLRHGDRIQIGEVVVEFDDDETRLAVAQGPKPVAQEPREARPSIERPQTPTAAQEPVNTRAHERRGVSANAVIIVVLAALLLAAVFLLARLGGIWFIQQAPTSSTPLAPNANASYATANRPARDQTRRPRFPRTAATPPQRPCPNMSDLPA